MKPHARLIEFWSVEYPPFDRCVTHGEAEVAAVENRLAVRFPPDFRDYLLHACPSVDDCGDLDRTNSAWWSLDRLRPVAEEYEHPLGDAVLDAERDTAIFFADHMLWCMAWAICCGGGRNYGRIFVVAEPSRFVAEDFGSFVEEYVKDDRSLRALL